MRAVKKISTKDKSKSIPRQVFLAFLDVFILLSVSALLFLVYTYFEAPIAANLMKRTIPLTTIIYDRTGEHVLYEIHGEENRKLISHDKIPNTIKIATIAAEDDSFYTHHGIDMVSTLRALLNNIKKNEIEQGGSTITQQLARNAFLSREKTLHRKYLEAILAIKIERKYSKDQILDMYFNQIPYGSNAYGIEAAAQTFFEKEAQELTLDESALLAALPKATTYYSPYGPHKDELISRQRQILERIAKLGLADSGQISEAKNTNTFDKVVPLQDKIEAPHFVFFVIDELEKKYGKKAVEEGGLRVYTTLDYNMQKSAEEIIQNESHYILSRYGASNASLVALNPKNGDILAMVGSKNYFDTSIDGQVNVAVRPRQPGSSFKPFAYAEAFEKGFQPETFVLDTQTDFGPDGSGKNYVPHNYDGKFHGLVTMRQALAMSLNIPAVKTLSVAGIDDTIELAHRMGISTLNDRSRYGLSLVLGGGEVKLLDMTSGFSVFANDGIRNIPQPILRIVDPKGNEYELNEMDSIPVLDQQIARKINSILSDNSSRVPIFGPNNKLFIPGKIVAAKTGTTQEYRDAWTIGYTPYLAVGVWAGNNDNHPMRLGADGSYVAAPIWNKFMSQAISNHPEERFIEYEKSIDNSRRKDIKIAYYKKKNGKKISEEKARDMDPDKVEARIEAKSDLAKGNIYLIADAQRDIRESFVIKNWQDIVNLK